MMTQFPKSDTADAKPVWIDLLDPTEAEFAEIEARLSVSLPRRGALSEIETSSRLRRRAEVLTMSTPTAVQRPAGETAVAPLGFVLAPDWLVTIHFTPLPSFDAVAERLVAGESMPASGPEMFVELCEEIVDRIADSLEHLAEELGRLSIATFHAEDDKGKHPIKSTRALRAQLKQVGRLGDRLSEVRDGLLGLGRALAFTEQFGCKAAEPAIKERVASLRQDLASLADYDEHLANKVQFVLDALVGLIGIAQNDIFRVLTVVSIVGIPPTLIAGIYGMNFKGMPEYDWVYGYPYGLTVIALSALLPMAWFKIRGWF
jgi:magnesium transporter